MAAGFICSELELDIVGDALDIDVRPFPFHFPIHGEPGENRVRLAAQAHASLTRKGLVKAGSITPELRRLVELFTAGTWSIAMVGTTRKRSYRVRASSDGQQAVLVHRYGDLLRFDPIGPDTLVREVVGLLPPMRAGGGTPVTIAADPPLRSTPTDTDFPLDVTDRQRLIAASILRRPRLGCGYFVLTRRDADGREGSPVTLTWIDTDIGRYLIMPRENGRITYLPTDFAGTCDNLSRAFWAMSCG